MPLSIAELQERIVKEGITGRHVHNVLNAVDKLSISTTMTTDEALDLVLGAIRIRPDTMTIMEAINCAVKFRHAYHILDATRYATYMGGTVDIGKERIILGKEYIIPLKETVTLSKIEKLFELTDELRMLDEDIKFLSECTTDECTISIYAERHDRSITIKDKLKLELIEQQRNALVLRRKEVVKTLEAASIALEMVTGL
ncbi:hypothetical protein D3C71_234640 [compost metagenome]